MGSKAPLAWGAVDLPDSSNVSFLFFPEPRMAPAPQPSPLELRALEVFPSPCAALPETSRAQAGLCWAASRDG
jgi:hypothetical protein